MGKKKVIVVVTSKLYLAGITTVLLNIANITKDQFNLTFALAESGDPSIIEQLREIGEVLILPSRQHHLLLYSYQLKKLMKQGHFDIAHIHGNTATMVLDLFPAYLCGISKRITHRHSCAPQPKIKQLTLGRIMNKLVTDPVACSKAAGEMLYNKSFTVINNSIDCEKFRYREDNRLRIRSEYGIPQDAFVIGHIGRFSEEKNHKRLISIFAEISKQKTETFLILCGTGETLENCQKLVDELQLQKLVVFTGEIVNPEAYYSAMDVFVLPSFFEGFPLVGVEAQANGLPCVFSDTITKETRILDESHYISLTSSDVEWAQDIIKCDKETDRNSSRTLRRIQAMEKVKKAGYDYETMKEQVLKLYE